MGSALGLCRVLRRRSWFYGMLPHAAFYGLYGAHGKTDKSPADMAALATADGYAVDGEGTIGDFLVDDAGKLGLACEEFSPSAASLVRYLKNGFVVIVNVGPGDFTDSGHFFVARGISSDGTIQINDPYSSVNTRKLGTRMQSRISRL